MNVASILFTMPLAGALLLSSCNKEFSQENNAVPSGEVTLAFQHSVDVSPLNYTDEYTTSQGEKFTVNSFRYYIHDVQLTNAAGKTVKVLPGYFLVDEDLPESKLLSFDAPEDTYQFVSFTLGVDSADNMSGAQSGALDPARGMFWTWASGYVMAKLEGVSPSVTGPNNDFTYHIGGYKSPYAVIKKIVLPVQIPDSLQVKQDKATKVYINADISTWFGRVNPIRMAATPACHSPGDLAKKIADNYEGMFSLKTIE